jgi:hypothetical protein
MLDRLKIIYAIIFPKEDGSEYSITDVRHALAWCIFLMLTIFLMSIRAGHMIFPLAVPFCSNKL